MIKPDITIYTAALCPFCDNAKNLLTKKGAEYQEVRIDLDPVKWATKRPTNIYRRYPCRWF